MPRANRRMKKPWQHGRPAQKERNEGTNQQNRSSSQQLLFQLFHRVSSSCNRTAAQSSPAPKLALQRFPNPVWHTGKAKKTKMKLASPSDFLSLFSGSDRISRATNSGNTTDLVKEPLIILDVQIGIIKNPDTLHRSRSVSISIFIKRRAQADRILGQTRCERLRARVDDGSARELGTALPVERFA